MLNLAFATGTKPGKWLSRYRENTSHGLKAVDSDDPLEQLLNGSVHLALARLPQTAAGDPRIADEFFVVRLYEEAPGIAVPKESVYGEMATDSSGGLDQDLTLEDVADEHVNYAIGQDGMVDVGQVREGLQVVAANVGIVIAPRPLLTVLSKKLVVPLGLNEPADRVTRTEIALVWPKAEDSDAIQDFVGVAKGRTANSTRQERPKLKARDKAKAKQARRQAQKPGHKQTSKAKTRRVPRGKRQGRA